MACFRDDDQRAAVAATFANRSESLRGWAFGSMGPSKRAEAIREGRAPRPGWSTSVWVLWNLAWAVMEDTPLPLLSEVIYTLDRGNLTSVGTFLVAFAQSPSAIDTWLTEQAIARDPRRYTLDGAEVDVDLFTADSQLDPEAIRAIRAMKPGEERQYGGGAAEVEILRRLA